MRTININLLAPEPAAATGLSLPSQLDIDPLLILIGVIGVAVSFGIPNLTKWGVITFLCEPADRQIAEQEAELKHSEHGSQELVKRQKLVEGLETDYQVLQGLFSKRGVWVNILEELRGLTPTDVWFDSLTTTGNDITIVGNALDYRAIAYFYTNFQHARNFTAPSLSGIKLGAAGDQSLVSFTLKATLAGAGSGK
ncbi:MAG: PilN domain-containing protein [Cyanobacteria bacterium NC_groundwater_1444_Ag_S-0.65um_54_12]|nr:PilN domain-containing protein [Cyanobacteria bacterium NC_groundwater_1444_Ag_S-0.65um_54_12]